MAYTAVRATLIAACIAPSLAANVWPRVSQAIAQGVADGGTVAIVTLMVVSVLAMAACPFAVEKAANWAFALLFAIFGLGLASLNFGNAVEVASHVRDLVRDPRKATLATAATLERDLAEARKSRTQLSHFTPTTAEGVTAAQGAVGTAIAARDQECGRVGENCRRRVAEVTDRQAELASATRNKALTDEATRLEGVIAGLQRRIAAFGPVPTHADPFAARIALILRTTEETVSEWWPTFVAGMIEAVAMVGPIMLMTAVFPRARAAPRKPTVARESATVATVARPKTPRKSKSRAATPSGDVRQFLESRTVSRAGARIRCKEVFDAYVGWCQERGLEPLSFTRFGTAFKAEGVGFDNKNNRGVYLNIGLIGTPKLVASSHLSA